MLEGETNMDIKEYYRRIYKKEWEDVDSNKKVVFKRSKAENDLEDGETLGEELVNGGAGKYRGSLSKKIVYYSLYFFVPILMIPLVLWTFDFLGAAVLVVISDMAIPTKLTLLSVQIIFTVLVVVSAKIILQKLFFNNKQ